MPTLFPGEETGPRGVQTWWGTEGKASPPEAPPPRGHLASFTEAGTESPATTLPHTHVPRQHRDAGMLRRPAAGGPGPASLPTRQAIPTRLPALLWKRRTRPPSTAPQGPCPLSACSRRASRPPGPALPSSQPGALSPSPPSPTLARGPSEFAAPSARGPSPLHQGQHTTPHRPRPARRILLSVKCYGNSAVHLHVQENLSAPRTGCSADGRTHGA